MKIDIGNLHVIDYYLRQVLLNRHRPISYICTREEYIDTTDFDIETEQREGWAYDD